MSDLFLRERRTLWSILAVERTHPLELLGGVSSVLRGTWMIAFPSAVHAARVSSYLEAVAPASAWGAALLVAGLIQITGLARDSTRLRHIANYLTIGLVFGILVGYGLRDRQSEAVILYSVMLLKQSWIVLRSLSAANTQRVHLIARKAPVDRPLSGEAR